MSERLDGDRPLSPTFARDDIFQIGDHVGDGVVYSACSREMQGGTRQAPPSPQSLGFPVVGPLPKAAGRSAFFRAAGVALHQPQMPSFPASSDSERRVLGARRPTCTAYLAPYLTSPASLSDRNGHGWDGRGVTRSWAARAQKVIDGRALPVIRMSLGSQYERTLHECDPRLVGVCLEGAGDRWKIFDCGSGGCARYRSGYGHPPSLLSSRTSEETPERPRAA